MGKRSWLTPFALLASFAADAADAGTAVLNWAAPTQCADNTAITNCPVTSYKVYSGPRGAAKTTLVTTVAGNVLTFTDSAVPVTGRCYDVTALSGTAESVHSIEVCKVPPAAPTGVTVASNIAYTVTKGKDHWVYIAAGHIPAGTQCDPAQCMGFQPVYCVVPSDSVTWAGSVRAQLVVAQCG